MGQVVPGSVRQADAAGDVRRTSNARRLDDPSHDGSRVCELGAEHLLDCSGNLTRTHHRENDEQDGSVRQYANYAIAVRRRADDSDPISRGA